jgi:transposase-like protein
VLAGGISTHNITFVMSTKTKKKAPTGVRYSDAQKKEVIDFVAEYNSAKGRGGQSAAAKKFKITPLTVAAWLKASGKKAKGSASKGKAAKAPAATKRTGVSKRGVRYSSQQKAEVVNFVKEYNAANGRGGQSQAAKKYGLSVLTVSAWLKSAGVKGGRTKTANAGKASAVPAGLNGKIASLIEVSDQLRKAESETARLRAKYDALRASIQALI